MNKYLVVSGKGVLGTIESLSKEDACKALGIDVLVFGPGHDDTQCHHVEHGYVELLDIDELPKLSYSYELDLAEPVFQVQ